MKKSLKILLILMLVLTISIPSANIDAATGGWKKDSKGYYYQFNNGTYAKNEYIDGYWLDAKGYWTYKYKATWKHNSKGWWYSDSNGWYAKNKWLRIDCKWYYFTNAGYIVTGWKKINSIWYYFDNGIMTTGWKKISGKWYYFNTSGKMLTGLNTINSKMYYFDKNGAMLTNQYVSDKTNTYYINKSGVATIHNHKYTVVDSREATCSTDGYIIKKCACGDTIKEIIKKDSNKHTWATIHNDATCSTKGNHKVYCTSCGKVAEEYEIEEDPTNHKNTTITIAAKSATCTEPGHTAEVYCNDCHTTITDSTEIPAIGHTLVHHAAKAATCTEDGNIEYWTCSTCGKILTTNDKFSTNYVSENDVKIAKFDHKNGTASAWQTVKWEPSTCHRKEMTTDKPINYDEIKDKYIAGYGYSEYECSICKAHKIVIDSTSLPQEHYHGNSEPIEITRNGSNWKEHDPSMNKYETILIAPKELASSEKGLAALERYYYGKDEYGNYDFDCGTVRPYSVGSDKTWEEFISDYNDYLPIWMIDHKYYTVDQMQQFINDYDIIDIGTYQTTWVYQYTKPYIEYSNVTYVCQVCGETYTVKEETELTPAYSYDIDGTMYSPNGYIIR